MGNWEFLTRLYTSRLEFKLQTKRDKWPVGRCCLKLNSSPKEIRNMCAQSNRRLMFRDEIECDSNYNHLCVTLARRPRKSQFGGSVKGPAHWHDVDNVEGSLNLDQKCPWLSIATNGSTSRIFFMINLSNLSHDGSMVLVYIYIY